MHTTQNHQSQTLLGISVSGPQGSRASGIFMPASFSSYASSCDVVYEHQNWNSDCCYDPQDDLVIFYS